MTLTPLGHDTVAVDVAGRTWLVDLEPGDWAGTDKDQVAGFLAEVQPAPDLPGLPRFQWWRRDQLTHADWQHLLAMNPGRVKQTPLGLSRIVLFTTSDGITRLCPDDWAIPHHLGL